jgi:hypothetical protein
MFRSHGMPEPLRGLKVRPTATEQLRPVELLAGGIGTETAPGTGRLRPRSGIRASMLRLSG